MTRISEEIYNWSQNLLKNPIENYMENKYLRFIYQSYLKYKLEKDINVEIDIENPENSNEDNTIGIYNFSSGNLSFTGAGLSDSLLLNDDTGLFDLGSFSFAQNGNDLNIFANNGSTITLTNQFSNDTSRIETLTSAAGQTIDLSLNNVLLAVGTARLKGTKNSDLILGDASDNDIVARGGADIIYGGAGNDTINAGGGADTIYAGGGNDTVSGRGGKDIIYGGAGNDILNGNNGNDTIYGGAGDDIIIGGKGKDIIDGGDGIDTVDYSGNTTGVNIDLVADTGNDDNDAVLEDTITNIEIILGSAFDDVLRGDNLLNMRIEGRDGNDTIYGQAQADELYGGLGNDKITGLGGDDLIYGEAGDDFLIGSGGNDTIYGGAGADQIKGREDNDTLYGNDGADSIWGESGNDVIYGGAGADFVWGGAGDDILVGGGDRDWLRGESGADTFLFESATAFNDLVFIKDFSAAEGDAFDISNLLTGYDPLTDAITDFVRFTESNGNTYLRVDTDGKAVNGGNFEIIARIDGVTGLDVDTLDLNNNIIA